VKKSSIEKKKSLASKRRRKRQIADVIDAMYIVASIALLRERE